MENSGAVFRFWLQIKSENKDGEFFVKDNNEVIVLSTGLAEMNQAGLLERTPLSAATPEMALL